ncbi:hypothetical protein [Streptomyces sp. NPDC004726]
MSPAASDPVIDALTRAATVYLTSADGPPDETAMWGAGRLARTAGAGSTGGPAGAPGSGGTAGPGGTADSTGAERAREERRAVRLMTAGGDHEDDPARP